MQHRLHIVRETRSATDRVLYGFRIVEIDHLLSECINSQYEHSLYCTLGKLQAVEETRRGSGLLSSITLKCNMCNKLYIVTTAQNDNKIAPINTAFVWGTTNAASTYTQSCEILAAMDIPTMPLSLFKKIENRLEHLWQETLYNSMAETHITKYNRKRSMSRLKEMISSKRNRKNHCPIQINRDYGEKAEQAPLSKTEILSESLRILNSLKVTI